MIKEFALDPAAISNWNDFRFFTSQFGCEYGRVISRFPKQWKKNVYDLCTNNADVTEIQLSRIEILLFNLVYNFDRKFVRNSRDFDKNLEWLENAQLSHLIKPFHAIISTKHGNGFFNANEIDDSNEMWKVETNAVVARTAKALVKYFKPFYELTNDIIFVEPHFDPGTYKWYHAFQCYFSELFNCGKKYRKIEIHTSAKIETEHFANTFKSNFEKIVKDGHEINVFMWDRIEENENFHPRYLLTEIGGIRIDYGYDEVSDNETTDVQTIGENLYNIRLSNIQPQSNTFKLKAQIKFYKETNTLRYNITIPT